VEYLQIQVFCTLCMLSIFTGILVPLYLSGANYYECGHQWLRPTAAYLAHQPDIQWACAVLSCVFSAFTLALGKFLSEDDREEEPWPDKDLATGAPTGHYIITILVWAFITLVLCIPSAMYALSNSMPPDNTLGISGEILNFFYHAMGALLSIINGIAVPKLAFKVATKMLPGDAEPRQMGNWVLHMKVVSIFCISVATPTIVTLWSDQGCYGNWIWAWRKCADPKSFDYSITLPLKTLDGHTYANVTSITTTHADVCTPSYKDMQQGMCARQIISVVGPLLIEHQLFFALFKPSVKLLWRYKPVANLFERVVGTCRKGYVRTPRMRWTQLIVDIQVALIFGFFVPILIPVTAWAVGSNYIVTWHAYNNPYMRVVHKQQGDAKPRIPRLHIFFAIVLQQVFLLWYFVANSMPGWQIVAVNPAILSVLFLGVRYYNAASSTRVRSTSTAFQMLQVPLLQEEMD